MNQHATNRKGWMLFGMCLLVVSIGGLSGTAFAGDKEYPTVVGGCFGNLPLVDGRVPTFLDSVGGITDGIGNLGDLADQIKDGVDTVREIKDSADTFRDLNLEKLQQFFKLTAGSAFNPDALKYGQAVLQSDQISQFLGKQIKAFDDLTGGLGKYIPVINKVLKAAEIFGTVCDVGTLVIDGYTALATGDEGAFVDMINSRIRDEVVDLAGMAGSEIGQYAGMWAGGVIGGAAGGFPALIGAPIGGFLGGIAGSWAGEQVGGWLYDQYISDWIKQNIAENLFAMLCPAKGIPSPDNLINSLTNGPPVGIALPPATPPVTDSVGTNGTTIIKGGKTGRGGAGVR